MLGQRFSAARYFHSRASVAGQGYDPTSSGGTNLGPTNRKLIAAVAAAVAAAKKENPGAVVPIDLVTTSASGLDPHITPDNAMFQVARVARARRIPEDELKAFVIERIEPRQLGILGEPRVNVLTLNLALDKRWPAADAF
jgi:K+-transporting ATPase ATPase C chain